MEKTSPEDRAEMLLAAPAGCALLLIAEEHGLTPEDVAKPEIALYAISSAVGQVSPWNGWGHSRVVKEAFRHAPRLRDRALALAAHPGIAWWWAPIDRANQLVLPQHDSFICPEEVWDLRPTAPPDRHERYAHRPNQAITSSDLFGNISSELAQGLAGAGDLDLHFPLHRRRATIRPAARVLDINTARDWHDLVRRYPSPGDHVTHLPDEENQPWGSPTGLMVPDWSQVVRDWDGVHITPWAFLTAIQGRVTSDIGWTEPWSWEGSHTLWLNWMFDTVEDLRTIDEQPRDSPHYWSSAFNFMDPQTLNLWIPTPAGGWPVHAGITREPFGEIDGEPVERITLNNDTGMSVAILTYGGIIQSLTVPDRHGRRDNVVLGFPDLDGYLVEPSPYFGAVVGRYANRIANGRFTLDGTDYQLAVNNGPNALHGGTKGFDKRVWAATIDPHPEAIGVILSRTSPDGEEGYPGTMQVSVGYQLSRRGNRLDVFYTASTDRRTIVNLTNHSYFNLAGEGNGDILRHVMQMRASHYTPVNEHLIPTGEIAPVAGTPFDFTEAHIIGERIDQPGNAQLAFAGGYDHNFVIDRPEDLPFHPTWNVRVIDPGSGRIMDVHTDQPGVQFYTGNFLDGTRTGPSGRPYGHRAGFCLETQHFPDSPNQPQFPSVVLEPGGVGWSPAARPTAPGFHSHTSFAFAVLS